MKKFFNLVFLIVFLAVGYFGYRYFTDQRTGSRPMDYETAVERLNTLMKDVKWKENFVSRRAQVQLGSDKDLKSLLPDIDRFPVPVDPGNSSAFTVAEIFVSTEKSGSGTDGWITETANAFNAKNVRMENGSLAKIRIRKIASGTGYEFIAARKYIPDAFSPSSHLWIRMVAAHGIPVSPIDEKLVSNIAGIVIKTKLAQELKSTYGAIDTKSLIDSVVQGKIAMGYTNPFASSTGLNFLVTVLSTFAEGRVDEMLSESVVSAFEGFQKGVPFVCQTTLQMRESVQMDGSLDAFVMEYQTFANTPELQTGYEFIPFGIRHDNPLYTVGNPTPEKTAVLKLFARFAKEAEAQKKAAQYGFNPKIDYESAFELPPGETLVSAQKIWKQKKDAGKPVSAIFLCDVSGSMYGSRIRALQRSLIRGSEFIATENSIGLVLFSDKVSVVVPVKQFNLAHKAMFRAAVEDLVADGGTAMYDGIAVALDILVKEKEKNPGAKTTLFVLTDGETRDGMDFGKIRNIIAGLRIPIYTIGYEADLGVLKELSSIVEAASLNSAEGEVEYKIGSLLNAQM